MIGSPSRAVNSLSAQWQSRPQSHNTARPELAIPRFNTCQKHLHEKLKRMSDMLDSTMSIGLNGDSVERILFTLLME